MRSTAVNAHGVHQFDPSPHFGPWWWVAVVLACLTPLFWCLVVGLPVSGPSEPAVPSDPPPPDGPDGPGHPVSRRRLAGLRWAAGAATVLVLALTFYNGTLAYGAVYTTALSAAQVREHYLAGSP